MAKKNIQVTYVVSDAALLKSEKALKDNEAAAKKADAAINKYGRDAKSAGDMASKSFLNLGNVWKGIAAIGITAFFVNLAKKTFELGVQQEQLNIAFTTFLGSAEKAKKLLAELTKFAIVTPFTPDQVNKAAKALLAFGVSGEQIIPTLKMLGDVSAGTGKDLTEMAIIFGQIRSTGRLMGQDLLQLINAGFNPLQVISEKTGKSVATLKKEMEAGLISFQMVSDAFKSATSEGGLFFNLMEKQSQSVGGILSTVEGNIDELLKVVFTANSGPLKTFAELLADVTEGMLNFFKTSEQVTEELDALANARFVEQFQAYAKAFKDLDTARTRNIEEIDREITALERRNSEMEAGVNVNIEEYNNSFLRIGTLKAEKKAIDDYVESLKKSNEQAALRKKLEADTAAAEEARKARAALLKEILNDAKNQKEGDGPTTDVTNLFKLTPEQEKSLEEDTKETLKRLDELDEEALTKKQERDEREVEAENEKHKRIRQIRQTAFDYGIMLLEELALNSIKSGEEQFEEEKGNFDERITAAGDNENERQRIESERDEFDERQALRREQFERDRARKQSEIQIKQMLVQNLFNAIKALGQPPVPNFVLSGITAAFGAAQVVAAKAIGFKEGVIGLNGPGTGTSDSIPARLSRGESVITAKATERSYNLLEAINDGKIDDRVLKQLKLSGSGVTVINDNKELAREFRESQVERAEDGYFTVNVVNRGNGFRRRMKSKYRN